MTGKSLSIAANTDVQWTEEKVALLKRTICKEATNDEFQLFLGVCQRRKLDPFARQIYAVKRWDAVSRREIMTPQISIDGQRLVAERTGQYLGQEGPYWCGEDGIWKEVWLSEEPPAAAKVLVYKRGFEKGIPAVAHYHEYAQRKQDGSVTKMWQERAAGQLAKCAESLALRKAFPEDLSGLYTIEEHPVPVIDVPQATPARNHIAETLRAFNKSLETPTGGGLNAEPLPLAETMIPEGHFRGIRLKDRPIEKWAVYAHELARGIEDGRISPEHSAGANVIINLIERYIGDDSQHGSDTEAKRPEGGAADA